MRCTARDVAAGRVWLLVTSALEPQPPFAAVQVAAVGTTAAVLARRDGARSVARAALAGHVGSALLAYAAIGAGVAAGSASAAAAVDEDDYGVSCVLLGLLGALAARSPRRLAALTAAAAALPADNAWHGIEHPLAVLCGAAA